MQPHNVVPGAEPHSLLDADSWTMIPAAVAWQLSGSNSDFTVVAVLGSQSLGKSSLLNRLLGKECWAGTAG